MDKSTTQIWMGRSAENKYEFTKMWRPVISILKLQKHIVNGPYNQLHCYSSMESWPSCILVIITTNLMRQINLQLKKKDETR